MVMKDEVFLKRIKWEAMVVDEAHMLKNGFSKRFQSFSAFKTGFRLLLTGTPLQNNLQVCRIDPPPPPPPIEVSHWCHTNSLPLVGAVLFVEYAASRKVLVSRGV
jgi:hypothetical protein